MDRHIVKYNPSFLSTEELIDNFVVRQTDLEIILRILSENVTDSNQHVLVIGPRGSGKTTLVRRIAAELERDKKLGESWSSLIFSEESYQVSSAGEFWLEAIFHLADQTGDEKWKNTYLALRQEKDENRLRERALALLLDFADSLKKRIILIVENLNMLLMDLITDDEAWKIRHTLSNEPRLMLLATATNRFEQIENSSCAMFDMFQIHELKRLDDDECNILWESIAGKKLVGEQIRPIRILTGGNPRLLVIIAKFSAHRSFGKLLDDIVDLIDDHTEYFKSHLDNLPPTERKVYLSLAELWDISTAREIANAARLDVSKTSSFLNRLVARGAVIVEDRGKKTKLYMVAERMYNIYYLMRRRGKPADRVKAVVKFMVSLYDPESATKLIVEEARSLSPEKCHSHYLAYSELIKEIPDYQLREKIINSTPKNFLENHYIAETVKNTMFGLKVDQARKKYDDAYKLFCKGDYEGTVKILDEALMFYSDINDKSVLPDMADVLINKGVTLLRLERLEDAIKVFEEVVSQFANSKEESISERVVDSLFRKGVILGKLEKFEEAIKAYEEVVTRFGEREEVFIIEQVARAFVNKSSILGSLGRFEEAIKACEEVISRFGERKEVSLVEQVAGSFVNKGSILGSLGRFEEAIKAYEEVVTRFGNSKEEYLLKQVTKALLNSSGMLGILGRFEESLKACEEVISRFDGRKDEALLEQMAKALVNKGITLRRLKRFEEAIKVFDEVISRFGEKKDEALIEPVARSIVNLAFTLSALGKGEEALKLANRYIGDAAFVERTIEYAIELFVELAASGYAKEALEILVNSPSAKFLEPLVIGLKLFIGEEVRAAVEILEVAKDVVKKIENRQKPTEVGK